MHKNILKYKINLIKSKHTLYKYLLYNFLSNQSWFMWWIELETWALNIYIACSEITKINNLKLKFEKLYKWNKYLTFTMKSQRVFVILSILFGLCGWALAAAASNNNRGKWFWFKLIKQFFFCFSLSRVTYFVRNL